MKNLKKIFTIGNSEKQVPKTEVKDGEILGETLTFKESGKSDSKHCSGNHVNLKSELQRIFQNFNVKCREDESLQEKLRQPHVEAMERCRTEKNRFQTLLNIKEKDKEEIQEKINNLEERIERIKQNPKGEGIPADPKPKVQFYIGLFLLLPITLYLMVFYISASYSAFFKEFGANANVLEAIFDAQALTKAMNDGWLEFVFIFTIPFAFMGLGYLLHMFQKSDNTLRYFKITGLVVVTFIFDAILAYQIDKGVFNVNKTLGQEFNMDIAVTSVSFWAIIFAGFVVYMIWGLVLDFVLKEHENKDILQLAIRAVEKDIERQNIVLNSVKEEIIGSNNKIKDCDNDVAKEQSSIDSYLIPVREYLAYHAEYVSGWLSYISGSLPLDKEEKQRLLNTCKVVSDNFLNENEFLRNEMKIEESNLNVA